MSVFVKKGHSSVSDLVALWLNAVSLERTDSDPQPKQSLLRDKTSSLLSLRQKRAGLSNCPIRGVSGNVRVGGAQITAWTVWTA